MSRDSIAPEIRLLLVSQLPQIDGARLVRLQSEIGQVIMYAARLHLKPNGAFSVAGIRSYFKTLRRTIIKQAI